MLGLLAGAGAVAVGACTKDKNEQSLTEATTTTTDGIDATTSTTAAPTATTAATTSGGTYNVGEIPTETGGPYPGDGTNGPNILTQSGVVRRDIRKSLTGSGVADGVGLNIALRIVDAGTGKVMPGAAVYLWHCDRQGRYSMYSQGASSETYLRGVQVADSDGLLNFTSVFPAAYDGRWPHIHFQIFDAAQQATSGRNSRKVTQLALPEATCREVYATSAYASSQQNMSRTSLTSDMVFRDGVDRQLATMTGSVSAGYTASLVVGV